MSNPFFKNNGPFKISEIIRYLNIKNHILTSDFEIQNIRDLLTSTKNDLLVMYLIF